MHAYDHAQVVTLERESGNPHASNAIKVVSPSGGAQSKLGVLRMAPAVWMLHTFDAAGHDFC